MRHIRFETILALLLLSAAGCDSGGLDPDDGGGDPDDGGVTSPDADVSTIDPTPDAGFPVGNDWSWNASWTPLDSDFPVAGLLDDEYADGHDGTPVLPPGDWDWTDANNDLANWNNYKRNLGNFQAMYDSTDRQFGWRFYRVSEAIVYRDAAAYFDGSAGVDYLDLGRDGSIVHFGQGNLRDGPDVLIFDASSDVDFRTGTTTDGSVRDDDLVIAGCQPNADGAFDIVTTQLHTGPGRDWVFARDLTDSAIDLGNADGLTDTLDAADTDDLAVVRGNASDFRVFGGQGDDVFVWFVDESANVGIPLGARFFGGGGWGDARFADNGNDRLVLAIPPDTEIVDTIPPPPGALSVTLSEGALISDDATEGYPRARHCVECGASSTGNKTLILQYVSADGTVDSGLFYLTSVEELQVGVGAGARVFTLDDYYGAATLASDATAFDPPEPPGTFCD